MTASGLTLILLLTCLLLKQIHAVCSRHVALFDRYETVRGPHFNSILDQLVERTTLGTKPRIAWCTSCQQELVDAKQNIVPLLKDELDFEALEMFNLSELRPMRLHEALSHLKPNVVWVADSTSVLQLMYSLKTSGLDSWIDRNCGGTGPDSVLYVGEGNGAIVAGSDIRFVAKKRGDAPAREPQFRGLELLGSTPSFYCGGEELDLSETNVKVVRTGNVFVWSQMEADSMSFTMCPNSKGSIESMRHPKLLSPLIDEEGVSCTGEPSVDPSRRVQVADDTGWMEDNMLLSVEDE